ncbi:MAG: asparagine synthase (glutamine-hydrolyzing) [Synergistetes bacterium]|nr:asparagine synthase (glutamine-hydrolyzing) [Synergistota bacterium]MDW8193110.1 asparagine synthase (glutamine-hydrolyzing) [Synergistota bacterium]
MCGIYGIFSLSGNLRVDPESFERAGECLRHRGPDAGGVFFDRHVALGHRRLSIIDLSQSANQPMSDEEEKLWIVFNGEIYNFLEERKRLREKGYSFRTRSDTEVILALYKERGISLLERLRGMFAFCLYDKENGSLFIARDRIGKKPLYYTIQNGFFAFASEPKVLVKAFSIPCEPNFEALNYYLSLGYIPSPLSAFKGINKLPPGSFIVVDRKGVSAPQKYWDISYEIKEGLSEEEWCEVIRGLLRESVKLRLISDVPLGVFLSGGIDSSAVTAFASEFASKVKTYSVGFTWSDYDERKYARIVADRFSTDHTEFIVSPNLEESLPWIIKYYDEPFGDSSAIPSLYISREASRSVKVILNGDGGDENFAGYERYIGFILSEKLLSIPGFRLLGGVRRIIPLTKRRGLLRKVRKFLELLSSSDSFYFYYGSMSYFKKEDFYEVLGSNWEDRKYPGEDYLRELFERFSNLSGIDRLLAVEVRSYLPEDLLVKMDRATMAFSLEGRSPLLDHIFMERMARIPPNLKLKGLKTKYIFKKALKGILPEEILNRGKMGFGVPLEHWFRGELVPFLRGSLYDGALVKGGLLRLDAVKKIVEYHIDGKSNEAHRIWLLLVLEYWWREYFEP